MPRKNTSSADYPQAVIQQIEQLAQNISIARKRRGESQAQWARKLGISQPTMARIERGDPSVAMASYVMCIWLIHPGASLAELIAPQYDHAALEKEVDKVRAPRKLNPQAPIRPHPKPDIPSAPSDLAGRSKRTPSAPASRARSQPPLAHPPQLPEPAWQATNPLDEVRKSLARTSQRPDPALPSAALGLAALLAASDPRKK